MLNLKNKIVVVGLLCVMPTYIMGKCNGQLKPNSLNVTCQGKSDQIQLSSVTYELLRKNNALKNIILDNSDTLTDIQTKTYNILPQINKYANQAKRRDKQISSEISRLNKLIYSQQNIGRDEKNRMSTKIARLKDEKYQIQEENSRQLYQLYKQHKKKTSYLESQLRSAIQSKYKVKQQLNYVNHSNKDLQSFITSATNVFSQNLSSNFENYTECLQKNNILANSIVADISVQGNNQSGGFSSFGGGSGISQIPHFSSSGISSSSLESCSNQFRSLKEYFTLYEVALNLLISSNQNKKRVVKNFFQVYKGIKASEYDVSHFIKAFNSFPKSDLFSLIQSIKSQMHNYKKELL